MTHALNLPVTVAVGNLESYIQTANRFPLLTEEEERDLARRFRHDGDIEAARGLVLSHLRLVVSVARGYLGYGLPHADLIQEGNVGLMKAVKRYDPERGVRLVSFAIHWIKAEIHEYILRNWRLVKVATTKAQRKLFFNLRSLKQGLGTMSGEEVGAMAKQLGVKPEEVREMERLQDEGLKQALSNLDERSRRIIERRWLAEGETATLHELADEYGVSAERIRQIESKAMQKMKGMLAHAA